MAATMPDRHCGLLINGHGSPSSVPPGTGGEHGRKPEALIHVCNLDRPAALDPLRQGRLDERIYFTIQDCVGIAALHSGAKILDQLVGLQHVGADLMTPADVGLAGRFLVGLLFALLELKLIQTRLEHGPGNGPVLDLRTFLLARDRDPRWNMRDPDSRVGGVDVLATRARRPIGVDPAIALIDLDLDVVIDDRVDPDRGKACMAPRVGIVRRYPHETVHAGLRLEPAVRVLALDLQRRRLDAGLFTRALIDEVDPVASPLTPTDVHAGQHLRPVLT